MQKEFKLSPLKETIKTYTWEGDATPGHVSQKYAVLFRGNIIGMFSSLYWAERFSKDCCNIANEIMKVDE